MNRDVQQYFYVRHIICGKKVCPFATFKWPFATCGEWVGQRWCRTYLCSDIIGAVGKELHEKRNDGRSRVRKLDAARVKRADQQLAVLARVVLQRRRARVATGSFAADKSLSFADFLKFEIEFKIMFT